ncbi:DLA class I histocompatibility antigen, A9/A9 alpha chain-like [Pelmatolapia mariae]|uniref:DLA class I histocompatibility antigen, A9/A9 alpha chain-like n=1 Tax=Pelmatolapia mariae TaxID=158779 RepID=UPI003211D41A
MKPFLFLFLLEIHGTVGSTHSLRYFYTSSSGVSNFPEFVAVGLVDEVQMIHYDSNTQKAEFKQQWMEKAAEDDPQYLSRQTNRLMNSQQVFKGNIDTLKQRFNQTGGVHINQMIMYGCEWDNETGKVKGYDQHGYDGEDFVALDLDTETWIAPTPQAVTTKMKWDKNRALIAQKKNYLTQECPEWLKKYVNYGRSSLMKNSIYLLFSPVLPSLSLLQKTPSSPVTCHATGFNPNRAELVWRKDGVELHEGVNKGEILPINDGNFQMSVNLDLSSVRPEDWQRYNCVFQFSGVNEDIVTKLDKAMIRTNKGKRKSLAILITIATLVLAVITFIVYKKRTEKHPPSPVENTEIQEQVIPKA